MRLERLRKGRLFWKYNESDDNLFTCVEEGLLVSICSLTSILAKHAALLLIRPGYTDSDAISSCHHLLAVWINIATISSTICRTCRQFLAPLPMPKTGRQDGLSSFGFSLCSVRARKQNADDKINKRRNKRRPHKVAIEPYLVNNSKLEKLAKLESLLVCTFFVAIR